MSEGTDLIRISRKVKQVFFKAHVPVAVRADLPHQPLKDAKVEKGAGDQVGLSDEGGQFAGVRGRRQFCLFHYVAVPQPTMMGANVADVVQGTEPTPEDVPVGNFILCADSVAIVALHPGEKNRHRAEIPDLDRDPEREGGPYLFL